MLPRLRESGVPPLLLSLPLALAAVGCGDDAPSGPSDGGGAPASLTIRPDTGTVPVGDTADLEAVVRDGAGEEVAGATVSWTTADSTLVEVHGAGRVVARRLDRSARIVARTDGGLADTVDVEGGPALTEAAVVVDSTVLALRSDRAARDSGVYRFALVGDSAPTIEEDDVVVGAEGPGFLRRVESVTRTGDRFELTTGPATIPDALRAGRLQFEATLDMTELDSTAAAGDVSFAPARLPGPASDITVRSDGTVAMQQTFRDGPFTLEATETVSLTPTIRLDYKVNTYFGVPHDVERFTLEADVEAEGTASARASADGSASSADTLSKRFARDFAGSVGALPVKGEVGVEVFLGYSGSAEGFAEVSTGETSLTGELTTTTRWDGSSLSATENFSDDFTAGSPDVETEAEIAARLWARPELQLTLYEFAGPAAGPEPYLAGEGAFHRENAPGSHCMHVNVTTGVDGKLRVKWTSFGSTVKSVLGIPDLSETYEGPSTALIDHREFSC